MKLGERARRETRANVAKMRPEELRRLFQLLQSRPDFDPAADITNEVLHRLRQSRPGFEDSYRAHREELLRFIRQYGGPGVDAENIAAEAWARALASWAEIDKPRAWVFKVAINLTKQAGREAQRTCISLDPGGDYDLSAQWMSAAQLPGAEWGALVGDITDAFALLPGQQRAAVLLDYRGWSRAEIAAALGCSTVTVRGHLHQGRAKLKRLLDEPQRETQPAPSTGVEGRTA